MENKYLVGGNARPTAKEIACKTLAICRLNLNIIEQDCKIVHCSRFLLLPRPLNWTWARFTTIPNALSENTEIILAWTKCQVPRSGVPSVLFTSQASVNIEFWYSSEMFWDLMSSFRGRHRACSRHSWRPFVGFGAGPEGESTRKPETKSLRTNMIQTMQMMQMIQMIHDSRWCHHDFQGLSRLPSY